MKQFKTESKRILDLMINSIYTNKEIFLRELISNASDALDKLYFKSLSETLGIAKEDLYIEITRDDIARTLKISDNGCGMTDKDLDNNLGVIAHSGTLDVKEEVKSEDIEMIGQFGVGFYSAFMVADKVEVLTKAYGSDKAYLWVSDGAEGYTVIESEKDSFGTDITLYIKKDLEDESYSKFLDEYTIKSLVKKYSDYVRYPINMFVTKSEKDDKGEYIEVVEKQTLNSQIPIWKKSKSEVSDEEYAEFYKEKFHDFEAPAKVISSSVEGAVNFTSLLFIPKRAPYDYYSKDFVKGLRLFTNGVMIMDKCGDLLPDCFGFVKGIVDSSDLQLNISRETLQQSRQLKVIANSVKKMLNNERESYEAFWKQFGLQLKFGVYAGFGEKKELLQDLLLFYSYRKEKLVTLDEFVEGVSEDNKTIYYLSGQSVESVKTLPEIEKLKDGDDVLILTDDVDEFCLRIIGKFKEKEFKSLSEYESKTDDASDSQEKSEMLDFLKEKLGIVSLVRLTSDLKSHAVCLTTQGAISLEMEKVLNSMPASDGGAKAERVLEINKNHKIYQKLCDLYQSDKDKCGDLADVLLTQAELSAGLKVENLADYSDKVCKLIIE